MRVVFKKGVVVFPEVWNKTMVLGDEWAACRRVNEMVVNMSFKTVWTWAHIHIWYLEWWCVKGNYRSAIQGNRFMCGNWRAADTGTSKPCYKTDKVLVYWSNLYLGVARKQYIAWNCSRSVSWQNSEESVNCIASITHFRKTLVPLVRKLLSGRANNVNVFYKHACVLPSNAHRSWSRCL